MSEALAGAVAAVSLGALGVDRGAGVLLKRGLRALRPGGLLCVYGADATLSVHLRAFARSEGHGFRSASEVTGISLSDARGAPLAGALVKTDLRAGRWRGALATGGDPVAREADARWGLALRGATVEAGGPRFDFALRERDEVWSDDAGRLYAQAASQQWDPATAVPWGAATGLPAEVEDAVVQVMTYLAENETAALMVNARFLAQVHPHFREVLSVLAVQAADEARHLEVFSRRATLVRAAPGLSTAGGQRSLQTLLEEPDFALASFLTSVLGEGTFLELLWFLHAHAPDEVTREIAHLAARDEARHVAFGLSHLARHAQIDPSLRLRLRAATERRYDALRETAGLNEEVFEALVLLAAGGFEPDAVGRGHDAVQSLLEEMHAQRQLRLRRLGFSSREAEELSRMHTRNFM